MMIGGETDVIKHSIRFSRRSRGHGDIYARPAANSLRAAADMVLDCVQTAQAFCEMVHTGSSSESWPPTPRAGCVACRNIGTRNRAIDAETTLTRSRHYMLRRSIYLTCRGMGRGSVIASWLLA